MPADTSNDPVIVVDVLNDHTLESCCALIFPWLSAIITLFDNPAVKPVTLAPKIVLYCPVVIPLPESYPIAVLLNPVVTSRKA
jgi:hypothetical protein